MQYAYLAMNLDFKYSTFYFTIPFEGLTFVLNGGTLGPQVISIQECIPGTQIWLKKHLVLNLKRLYYEFMTLIEYRSCFLFCLFYQCRVGH